MFGKTDKQKKQQNTAIKKAVTKRVKPEFMKTTVYKANKKGEIKMRKK